MADYLDQLEYDLAQIEEAMRHVDAGEMDAFADTVARLDVEVVLADEGLTEAPAQPQP